MMMMMMRLRVLTCPPWCSVVCPVVENGVDTQEGAEDHTRPHRHDDGELAKRPDYEIKVESKSESRK